MRILHTSDWHVGKTLRGRSRAAEHEAVLAEVASIARDQAVDLALVAGDLFDTAAPTPESERIVYRALLDLVESAGQVVVIAGNHDNPHRLAAVRPLLDLGGVHLLASIAPPDQGGVLDLAIGGNGETARIALVPFPSQRYIVTADALMDESAAEHAGQYAERAARVVDALTREFTTDTVNLIVAHLMVLGGTLGGGERGAHTIFDYCVPATAFPVTTQYVALGHLHRPQSLPGPCPLRYSGSPLQLDFGETADTKSIVIIDVTPGVPAVAHTVPLQAGRRLRTVSGSLAEVATVAGSTGEDYVRVVIDERPRPGLADDVRQLFPDAVEVVIARPADEEAERVHTARLGRDPGDLFAEYLASRDVDDPRLLRLFGDLHDEEATGDAA